MVIDTSALLAILFNEPEAEPFARAIAEDGAPSVSAFTVLEASAVLVSRVGDDGPAKLDLLLQRGGVAVAPFTEDQSVIARRAYDRFGKGRHRAGLNLGDCCSYALARYVNEPLLFKGDDFAHTDIVAALALK